MAEELATATYLVSEPFELTVRSLRQVLADANLKIVGELDTSVRIRQRLLIGAAPCRVFFVAATPVARGELGADPRGRPDASAYRGVGPRRTDRNPLAAGAVC